MKIIGVHPIILVAAAVLVFVGWLNIPHTIQYYNLALVPIFLVAAATAVMIFKRGAGVIMGIAMAIIAFLYNPFARDLLVYKVSGLQFSLINVATIVIFLFLAYMQHEARKEAKKNG